jgi:hypothetical protein
MTKTFYIKLINWTLIIASVGLIGFEASLLTRAQEGTAAETATETAVPAPAGAPNVDIGGKCADALQKYLDKQKVDLGEFINSHFRSDKMTSELISGAVEKFRQYRNDARIEMNNLLTPRGGASTGNANEEKTMCQAALEQDFGMVKELLKQHISANASAKKATRLIDRYKQINAKLGELNFTIAQMYGYFAAFSDKLPCYAASCITN